MSARTHAHANVHMHAPTHTHMKTCAGTHACPDACRQLPSPHPPAQPLSPPRPLHSPDLRIPAAALPVLSALLDRGRARGEAPALRKCAGTPLCRLLSVLLGHPERERELAEESVRGRSSSTCTSAWPARGRAEPRSCGGHTRGGVEGVLLIEAREVGVLSGEEGREDGDVGLSGRVGW